MNITSLLITLAGIFFIIALYIISRISQSKLPKNKSTRLPTLEDDDGNQFSSVLDDIPARDGSTPKPIKTIHEAQEVEAIPIDPSNKQKDRTKEAPEEGRVEEASVEEGNEEQGKEEQEQQQHILFISGKDDSGLDGSLVKKALEKNGLTLGDMDIYHYFSSVKDADPKAEKYSLFRVANGTAPWTLKQDDLVGKNIAGLSIVMITPTRINNYEAISLFISFSEKICKQVNGVLKNQQQQLFSSSEKKNLLSIFKN